MLLLTDGLRAQFKTSKISRREKEANKREIRGLKEWKETFRLDRRQEKQVEMVLSCSRVLLEMRGTFLICLLVGLIVQRVLTVN